MHLCDVCWDRHHESVLATDEYRHVLVCSDCASELRFGDELAAA